MIRNVHKHLFIGLKDDLDTFFETAQKRGFVEFISPRGKKPVAVPPKVAELQRAIKILSREGSAREVECVSDVDLQKTVKHIIQCKKEEDAFEQERRQLKKEIATIAPLGHFSLDDIRAIEKTGRSVQFFALKQGLDPDEAMIFLSTDHGFDYYMAIAEKRLPHQRGWTEISIERSLGELKHRLEVVEIALAERHEEIMALTPYIPLLRGALLERLSDSRLAFAKEEVEGHFEGALFSVEAWVPETALNKVKTLLRGLAIHAEEIAIEEGDSVPTVMENPGLNGSGEDLVHIYDTPAPDDKDPSGWVLWFFAFFFGIIVADGGYGMVYLALSLFLRWKLKKKARKIINLFTLLSASCVFWGILSASYFGINIGLDNPLQKVSITNALVLKKADYHIAKKDDVWQEWVKQFPSLDGVTSPKEFLQKGVEIRDGNPVYEILVEFDDNIMMDIAILIGIVHLILSMLRYVRREWSSLGWIFFLIGGYMYFPKMLNATTIMHFTGVYSKEVGASLGFFLLWGGLGLAVLLAIIRHRLAGLEEPTKVMQIFSDVLSYLRLYALGLAGMVMASTFNQIGVEMGLWQGGILVILIGHAVNMVIGIMGGVIHGLRLNFLEWYHYSFTGGGRQFNPLRILGVKQ